MRARGVPAVAGSPGPGRVESFRAQKKDPEMRVVRASRPGLLVVTLIVTVATGVLAQAYEPSQSSIQGTTKPAGLSPSASDVSHMRVSATEFSPEASDESYSRSFGRLYPTDGSGLYGATVHLPQGVRLTSLQVDFCDSSETENHLVLTLYDCNLSGDCLNELGRVASVSNPTQPCSSRSIDISALKYSVDNASRSLYLRAVFGARDRSNQLSGVLIAYTTKNEAGDALKALTKGSRTRARQGESATEFRSPMIIETPFFIARMDPSVKETRDWTWADDADTLRWYHCDGVFISVLGMKLKRTDGGKTAIITVKAGLTNPHSHDKSVAMDFEVYNGSVTVSKFRIGPLRVEESDSPKAETGVAIPSASLIKDPITMMRITMTVFDR